MLRFIIAAIALLALSLPAAARSIHRVDRCEAIGIAWVQCENAADARAARRHVRRKQRHDVGLGTAQCFLFFCPPPAAAPARRGELPADRTQYVSMVDAAAMSAGVPSSIARAVIRHESNFNPTLTGRAGEIGLGQIKCQTARGEGFSGPCSALYEPRTNLVYAMSYLRKALSLGRDTCSGLALYQRGLYGRASCSSYGRKVMARAI